MSHPPSSFGAGAAGSSKKRESTFDATAASHMLPSSDLGVGGDDAGPAKKCKSDPDATEFNRTFREWYVARAKIAKLKSALDELKSVQSNAFDNILEMAQANNTLSNPFRIGGEVFQFANKHSWSTLSFKYVEQILSEKFGAADVELVGDIMTRLKDGRVKTTSVELKSLN